MAKKHKSSKHFDMEETIQDNQGGDIKIDETNKSNGHKQKDRVGASKSLSLVHMEINHPPPLDHDGFNLHSPVDEGWIVTPSVTGDERLIRDLMEDIQQLKRDVKRKDERLKEATTANEKWYRYNEKVEEQMEKMRKKVKQLETDLAEEKQNHAQTTQELKELRQTEASYKQATVDVGMTDNDLPAKLDWTETELQLTQQQLAYCQKHLREYELRQNIPEDREDWQCSRCTLINSGKCIKCEACGYEVEIPVLRGELVRDGPFCFDD